MSATYVFLAGISNSEPAHWQSLWRARAERAVWVEHRDWDHPHCEEWLDDLERTWRVTPGRKVVVAHSLGCLLFAEWFSRHSEPAPALLVAAPDVASPAFPAEARGFRSAFDLRVPPRSKLVASHDDRYASFAYAEALARHWHVDLVDVGCKGHINAASCLGTWDEGWELIGSL